MAAPAKNAPSAPSGLVEPYIPASQSPPEFTWSAVLLGTILGIVFGTSSLYLVLKVGMTVSASIPVAVMSITLFRWLSRAFGLRPATILENNIVQTTGSAGESIAFGIGVTLPALMLLGFDMEATQVMTVGVLGGLLGILMMIPLRKAFIVKQHGELPYPEGTACAEVLVAGEKGGSTAKTVFVGFGLAFFYNFLCRLGNLWPLEVGKHLFWTEPLRDTAGNAIAGTDRTVGLPAGELSAEVTPELLGVGYIIGPKIAGITFAGGVLAYLILTPMIAFFGEQALTHIAPATPEMKTVVKNGVEVKVDKGLIANMGPSEIRNAYILYIGAGAVATGGIISMFKALPMILGAVVSGLRDLFTKDKEAAAIKGENIVPRTERDLPLWVVIAGSLGLLISLMAIPQMGLGFSLQGALGAGLILFFGFLFVTVSARLTGSIGSSSNPISGMTISALLLTCLIFLGLGKTMPTDQMTVMIIAAVVCVASSNGGTTAQDLKTGQLVGATPRSQQFAILIGALTSALVIGVTLIFLNQTGTIWSKTTPFLQEINHDRHTKFFENLKLEDLKKERAGGDYATDEKEYFVLHVKEQNPDAPSLPGVKPGKYLLDENKLAIYYVDPPINSALVSETPEGKKVRQTDAQAGTSQSLDIYDAPKTRLMQIIIDGVMNQKLPWRLVLLGALISIMLELCGISSLPFAVGVYLPIAVSTPIFIGGMIRWFVDAMKRSKAEDSDSSPGVLLCSGYIAGGAIAGVLIAFMQLWPAGKAALSLQSYVDKTWFEMYEKEIGPIVAYGAFGLLAIILLFVGLQWFLSGANSEPSPSPKPVSTPKPTPPKPNDSERRK